ncbi:concanavalin A-like lectin/glucanase [Pseudovirgaria hyperparasitica]|uniref:Crh-like protein n=1 Tax=Pseudovirgaria hyperparasitica TaxID=470096 RepID=A0A6A6W6Q2_9PEZI|nr:concanavalin A-like lectin/glucanase [Pseudovirgaria hyperparasitica]KAF2757640.1 concanavalin A-like lectin/glucanase [Pseudovirgaria hyperparasitica]
MALRYSTAALAALLPFVSAQTFSACNPMKKSGCPDNPALPQTFESDFRKGESAFDGWNAIAGQLSYQGDGAHFTIEKQGQSTTIQTDGYAMYGRFEVRTKAAAGTGIVSSIVLQSESLDEFDWEFLGSSPNEVQVNYFGKGDTTTYDRMTRNPVANAQANVHTYIVDWNAERAEFWIDSTRVRVITRAEANGGANYPQTPMNLRIGIWAGGDPNNEEGTIAWAGGKTDFSQAPFTQVLESIKITNFSPGSAYKWTDMSGNSDSIEVVGGDAVQSPSKPDEEAPSSTPTPSAAPSSSGAESSSAPESAGPKESAAYAPGGLGGGNGGVTQQATTLAPEATAVVNCSAGATDSFCQTAAVVTPAPTPSGAGNGGAGTQPTGTGAAPRATAIGGIAVAAGVVAALLS